MIFFIVYDLVFIVFLYVNMLQVMQHGEEVKILLFGVFMALLWPLVIIFLIVMHIEDPWTRKKIGSSAKAKTHNIPLKKKGYIENTPHGGIYGSAINDVYDDARYMVMPTLQTKKFPYVTEDNKEMMLEYRHILSIEKSLGGTGRKAYSHDIEDGKYNTYMR